MTVTQILEPDMISSYYRELRSTIEKQGYPFADHLFQTDKLINSRQA